VNIMPKGDSFADPMPTADELLSLEEGLLARCLAKPDAIAEVSAKIAPNDLQSDFHRSVLGALVDLHDQGRTPSIEALVARFGDEEIAPNVTPRRYFMRLLNGAVLNFYQPLSDLIEVVKDCAARRTFSDIGTALSLQASNGGNNLVDVGGVAVERLDDVLASLRSGKRRAYDAAGAATLALEHLDSKAAPYPTTGLQDLDKVTGGIPLGQSMILAARPGMGKSAAASSIALRAAMRGHSVLFFSLEMTGVQLGARLLTDLAWSYDDPILYEDILQRRTLALDERKRRRLAEAHSRLRGLPLTIEEQRGLTFGEIAARSRKHAQSLERHGRKLEVVVIDHMLLVRPTQRYAGNRVREVAEISDGIATLAKDLHVAILALCQLNRGVEGRENKRPGLADLKDSGAIEEDASVVTFLYRPAYYLEQQRFDEPEAEQSRIDALAACRNSLEFIVAKNRNGRQCTVDAYVDIGANAVRNAEVARGKAR
jgi:replicative DNA helicase